MSKAFKNIAIFTVWLAGLVIIVHLIIPHDHHDESSVINKEVPCAANSDHPHKSPAFPVHCHALNDITFEKTSPAFVADNIPVCDLFVLTHIDSVVLVLYSSVAKIRDYQIPLIKIDFLRLSPFRAPPTLV